MLEGGQGFLYSFTEQNFSYPMSGIADLTEFLRWGSLLSPTPDGSGQSWLIGNIASLEAVTLFSSLLSLILRADMVSLLPFYPDLVFWSHLCFLPSQALR